MAGTVGGLKMERTRIVDGRSDIMPLEPLLQRRARGLTLSQHRIDGPRPVAVRHAGGRYDMARKAPVVGCGNFAPTLKFDVEHTKLGQQDGGWIVSSRAFIPVRSTS